MTPSALLHNSCRECGGEGKGEGEGEGEEGRVYRGLL